MSIFSKDYCLNVLVVFLAEWPACIVWQANAYCSRQPMGLLDAKQDKILVTRCEQLFWPIGSAELSEITYLLDSFHFRESHCQTILKYWSGCITWADLMDYWMLDQKKCGSQRPIRTRRVQFTRCVLHNPKVRQTAMFQDNKRAVNELYEIRTADLLGLSVR